MSDSNKDIVLTDDNKVFILANVETLSLKELAQKIGNSEAENGQTRLGRSIKEFIVSQGATFISTKYTAKGAIELNESQMEDIKRLSDSTKTLELTKIIFNDPTLTALSREFKAVNTYKMQIAPNFAASTDVPADEDYKVPTSVYRLIPLVNKYVPNSRKENEPMYDPKKLQSQDEKNLRCLLSYMQIPRFGYEVKKYNRAIDREIFESTFIGLTFDKPDLLREEREQYISLASEIVTTTQMERHIQVLEQEIQNSLNAQDTELKKLSMTLIEALDSARDKLDKSKERQKKLISELTGSRADRMAGKIQQNASILNLVEAWQNEVSRTLFLEIAERQKQAERDQIKKIAGMDAVIAIMAGLTENELTN